MAGDRLRSYSKSSKFKVFLYPPTLSNSTFKSMFAKNPESYIVENGMRSIRDVLENVEALMVKGSKARTELKSLLSCLFMTLPGAELYRDDPKTYSVGDACYSVIVLWLAQAVIKALFFDKSELPFTVDRESTAYTFLNLVDAYVLIHIDLVSLLKDVHEDRRKHVMRVHRERLIFILYCQLSFIYNEMPIM